MKLATAKLKMQTLPAGFPWLSVVQPSSFPIDIVIEVFSSFELLIVSLTLLMFWTYRSQRLPRFRQASILHFKAFKNSRHKISISSGPSSVSNSRFQNLRLNLRLNLRSILCTNLLCSVDAALIYRYHRAEKQLDVSFIFVELGGLFAMFFAF